MGAMALSLPGGLIAGFRLVAVTGSRRLRVSNVPLCVDAHKGTYAQGTVMSSLLRDEAPFIGKPARFVA